MKAKHRCYLCKADVERFIPYKNGLASVSPFVRELELVGSDVENFLCPFCGCFDRERHLCMYFDRLGLWEKFQGELSTHDGQRVWFFSNRFKHAFMRDSSCQRLAKDEIDINRVRRVKWIEHLVAGDVAGCSCRLLKDSKPDRPDHRLYTIDAENYVVMLLPRADGGWTFSTAYKAFNYQMRKLRESSSLLWKRKQ